jgi:hypothetical protein
MKLKRILICCSLNPAARDILVQSAAFAANFAEDVYFCHVGEDQPEVRRRLFLFFEDLKIETKHPFLIRPGRPDQVVVNLAKEIGADLIMAGALAHESSLVGIFGSVARRIVRHAHCSVLLLTYPLKIPFENITVEVFYDEPSRRMVSYAIALSSHYKSKVHVVHEFDYRLRLLHSEEAGDEKAIKNYECQCETLEEQRLRDFLKEFDWRNMHPIAVCLKGNESGELADYGRRANVDLMIVPIKTMSFWDRFFHSRVEVLLQDLPCSILFFRVTSHE